MRLIRYILFIPALFAGMFLSRIIDIVTAVLLQKNDFGTSLSIWAEFVSTLIAVTVGIELALMVYPNKIKKIPLAIVGLVLLSLVLLSIYSVYGLDEEFGETTRRDKIKLVFTIVAYMLSFGYFFKKHFLSNDFLSEEKAENKERQSQNNFDYSKELFKVYYYGDFFFFNFFGKFDMINFVFVDEDKFDELFDANVKGVPVFFSVQNKDLQTYKDEYGRDWSRLENNSLFAVFLFEYVNSFNTGNVSGVKLLSFNKIEVYKKISSEKIELYSTCMVGELRENIKNSNKSETK